MSFIAVIYIVTAVVSIVIALLLLNLTKLSYQKEVRLDRKRKKDEYQTLEIMGDEYLKQKILNWVGEFVDSKINRQEITASLSDIFNKELEKRVTQNAQELSSKYGKIIEEKAQKEEIAWKKYSKILNDKKNTEAVIRSIAEGLVVVDAEGKVIMMNPAAERLLGILKKDKVGKSILENLKEEHLISLVKGSQDKDEREIELISQKDDTKRILRASSAVIENENGQSIGMVSVLSDVTKQKELDQMKSNFISNITHELRTPLVATQKSIMLLLTKSTGQISNAQEHFLTVADRNLKRLSLLIDDLLDLAKLEAGRLELEREQICIEKIIDDAIDNLQTWATTKSITIQKKIRNQLPDVNIDADRITQVLNNLIANAIKFTPEKGNITIEAIFKNENNELEISVADTGIGIAKEDLMKVFDKFYQAGERMLTDISGTGIGLSIAKEIVELHGGKIWAESDGKNGAKFTFSIPVNK